MIDNKGYLGIPFLLKLKLCKGGVMTNKLIAYQVGECDIVAAHSKEEAIAILAEVTGYEDYDLSDVYLVSTKQVWDQDSGCVVNIPTTLREDIAKMDKAGWVTGWE